MLKALEVFKNHIIDLEEIVNIFDEYAMFKTRDETKIAIKELNEAIAELEALNNRSCENCRHLEKKEKNLKFECLLEVCRTCTRNNNDNWEVRNERN